MKNLRKVINLIKKPNFWPLLVIIIFTILAGRSLFFESGYFNMHDDLQIMRQLQMEKCFLDGQIPCRWVPDMGYGFGFPLFNFYPPLPYLIGQGIRLIGYSFITTVKLTFALSFVVSGVGMYLLAKDFFGKLGGVLASIFYIWAPYHAVDVYVRGAMNEAWALATFPFILWTGYRLIVSSEKNLNKWIIGLALSWFALLTSHNLMVLIIAPVFALWLLIHLWGNTSWRRIPQLIISGIIALGLAAFFTIPAIMENKFTQIQSQLSGYYDFTAHFVTIKQLLVSRFWGYGPSVWLQDDGMSFQIGHVHWVMSLVVGMLIVLTLWPKRKKILTELKSKSFLLPVILLLSTGWVAAFLTHQRSTPIWQAIPALRYTQFPWRFLAIIIFAFSFVIGAIPTLLSKSIFKGRIVFFFLVAILIGINWNYFKPEGGKMGPLTDEEKFSGAAWELQQTAGIYDYLPATAEMAPREPQKVLAEFMDGNGMITNPEQGTYWAKFNIDVTTEAAHVRINIMDFPNWRIFVDNTETEITLPEDEKWGRIRVDISQGEHLVYAQIFNTPVRTIANLVSLVSWLVLGVYLISRKHFKVLKFKP